MLPLIVARCGTAPHASDADVKVEQDLILRAVQDFFQALEARERVRLEHALHEEATVTRIDTRGDSVSISAGDGRDWMESVCVPGPPLIERMQNAQVAFTGNLANVWTYYDFHIGDELSHCGYDAFQLVKTDSEDWRILGVTYTIETCP